MTNSALYKNAQLQSQSQWYIANGATVDTIVNALKTKGPFTTYLDGGTSIFQGYSSGIINNTCCYKQLNHAVLTVGYGIDGN
jgi:hypothetical protein